MVLVTQILQVSDADAAKDAWLSFRESFEAAGATDTRVHRDAENPNVILSVQTWPSVEACKLWGSQNDAELMSRFGSSVQSIEAERFWEEF